MNQDARHLLELGEAFASGLLEFAEGPLPMTFCRGYRRYYEHCPIVYRAGEPLFPAGITTNAYTVTDAAGAEYQTCINPNYALQYSADLDRLEARDPRAAAIMREYFTRFHYAGEWNHSMTN